MKVKIDKNVANPQVIESDVLLKIIANILHGNFESLNLGRVTWE